MPRNEMKGALADVNSDEAECHWCMRVMKKEEMRKSSNRNAVVYVCPNCQPR